eukprot:scaffold11546_cov129-Isochrysis_galbana.AAC.1
MWRCQTRQALADMLRLNAKACRLCPPPNPPGVGVGGGGRGRRAGGAGDCGGVRIADEAFPAAAATGGRVVLHARWVHYPSCSVRDLRRGDGETGWPQPGLPRLLKASPSRALNIGSGRGGAGRPRCRFGTMAGSRNACGLSAA